MEVLPAATSLSPPSEDGRSVATVDRVALVTFVESLITVFPLHDTVPMILRFINERRNARRHGSPITQSLMVEVTGPTWRMTNSIK